MSEENEWIKKDWIFDIETYPTTFTFSIIRGDGKYARTYEVSDRVNQTDEILTCLRYLKDNDCRMVGFNNIGFDYPVIHSILQDAVWAKRTKKEFAIDARRVYTTAMDQIESGKSGWPSVIHADEEFIKQVDLFKIWHFDNKAKATSLKMLEFNMKENDIEDLPFPVGTILNGDQIDVLKRYNAHDVKMTLSVYEKSKGALMLRAALSEKYGIDFTNHNDTKIGKDYFIHRLEEQSPGSCYKYENGKRKMNQTRRRFIKIKECLFDYYDFKRPEFQAILEWFGNQVITETKGVFTDIDEAKLGGVAQYAELVVKKKKFKAKPNDAEMAEFLEEHPKGWVVTQELKAMVDVIDDQGNVVYEEVLNARGKPVLKKKKTPKLSYWMCWKEAEALNVVIDGFRFDFGVGGIHGSLDSKIVRAKGKRKLKDADVSSMYPNIAIANRVYPKHLGEGFCDIYESVYNERKLYGKGTPENLALKLALNGVYGDSNNEYSPFYDSAYTMTITINGQLSLCLLAERLMEIPTLKIVQVNTDGVTVLYDEEYSEMYNSICDKWQKDVGLNLEYADYSAMYIRDVNNYIAVYENGDKKRKGAYEYEGLDWHQNHSSLVIPKAAEAVMVYGVDVENFIRNHDNKYDFMLRTKVPRSSKLLLRWEDGHDVQVQNICRYYPSLIGGKLIKVMPPIDKTKIEYDDEGNPLPQEREIGIDKEWNVKVCNDITRFDWDDLNFNYYIDNVNKLLITEEFE